MRRKRKFKQQVVPDTVYGNMLVAKFINRVMQGGKKSTAQKIVYGAFAKIEKEEKKDPLEIFDQALKNVGPALEVKSRRVGGATYQVPREVRGERRTFLALRWIVLAARSRKGKAMVQKLSEELLAAARNEGVAVKKRQDMHRMAEANRAFAHYSW